MKALFRVPKAAIPEKRKASKKQAKTRSKRQRDVSRDSGGEA